MNRRERRRPQRIQAVRLACWLLVMVCAVPVTAEMRLELVRESLTGRHCRYRNYLDGIPSDWYEVRPCPGNAREVVAEGEALRSGMLLRSLNGRVLRREIVETSPLEPHAYDYDLETGALVRVVPLFFRGKEGNIFDPNPVVTLNDPTLQDRSDARESVPSSAYRTVELPDLAPDGPLRGPHVKIVDRQAPNIAPVDAAAELRLDRSANGFEDVNVYVHIDRTQRHLQSLGYIGNRTVVGYAIEADAHSANGTDNSFFLPSATRFAEGTLHFGEGGTDDAEDADLIVHEYGHAILEWIAPGSFGGSFAGESRALSEGFGDYLAYSAHRSARLASGRDPYCLADWDARCWEDDLAQQCSYPPGADCLRRLDSSRTMADYERTGISGVEHRNGSIWSSALREIHDQLGRTITDTIVIESLFDVPPHPTYAILAQRMVEADQLLFDGAHRETICAAMRARGIQAECDGGNPPARSHFQSADQHRAIPDNDSAGITSSLTIRDARVIERVFVRVDIAHPLRGDLHLTLVAPDGTTTVLLQPSGEHGVDVRTTFGLTAQPVGALSLLRGRSAAGVWKLIVRDLRSRDAGTLLSWGLIFEFAGDGPLIARPRGVRSQMIPVVAHLLGVGATRFASDVRVANPGREPQTATLVFTRSGEDGSSSFAAIDVALEAGQTVSLDDVVDGAFHTMGSGSLEILGDVVVMSRTYSETAAGQLGQQVPPNLEYTSRHDATLLVAPLPLATDRYNLGITETGGGRGVIRAGGRDFEIAPFSHVQFPIEPELVEISIRSGDARVVGYISQIHNGSTDPMFIPAAPAASSRRVGAPVVSAPGANGSDWRSDLWLGTIAGPMVLDVQAYGRQTTTTITIAGITAYEDVLARLFRRTIALATLATTLQLGVTGGTRVRNGAVSQFVPLLDLDGPAEQHLLFVESGAEHRTNIGIASEGPVVAEFVILDAAGNEVARQTLASDGGVVQAGVEVSVFGGRAVVRFLAGSGRAYLSLVDNRTGDATFVAGQ